MNNEKVSELLESKNKDISQNNFESLKEALKNAEEDKYENFSSVELKKLSLTTLLSSLLGLFGAGDFYLGNFKRGITKLVCSFVVPIILVFTYCLWAAPEYKTYKKVNVPYFAIYSSRIIVKENLIDTEMRDITRAEVLGADATDGTAKYQYAFSDFVNAYSGTSGVVTKFKDFENAVTELSNINAAIEKTKTETEKLKNAITKAKTELNGETIPEAVTNYENALKAYEEQYADYEAKITAYEEKLETFTDDEEIELLLKAIKNKEDGDLKELKKSFDSAKTQLGQADVDAKFNKLISALNALEAKLNDYSKNLTDYKTATQNYNTAITDIIPAVNTFTEFKKYYGYIVNSVKVDKEIDEKYAYNQGLSQYLTTVDKIIAQSPLLINGESIKQNMPEVSANVDKAFNGINSIYVNTEEYHLAHRLSIPTMNIFLIVLMIVYFTIVVAYWVFEVFRNREKCKQLNYEALMNSLK